MSILLRLLITEIPVSVLELLIIGRCFARRKSLMPMISVTLLRVIIQHIIIVSYLPLFIKDQAFLNRVNVIATFLFLIIQLYVSYLTFGNETTSFTKIYLITFVCDALWYFVMAAIFVFVNTIEGYSYARPFDMAREFQLLDLLVPILLVIAYRIIVRFGTPVFNYLKTYQLRFPLIWRVVVIITIIMNSMTTFTIGYYEYLYLCNTLLLIIISLLLLMAYRNSIKRETLYLKNSQVVLQNHYDQLQSRIEELESQRQDVNRHMSELAAKDFPEDLTETYLEDMNRLKSTLHQSLFTHYYMIDAVLSEKAHDYDHQNVIYHFDCTGLTLTHISEVQIAQILMTLFSNIEAYHYESIDLKISSYQNQIMIILSLPLRISTEKIKRQLKSQVSTITMTYKNKTLHLSIDDQ